VKSAINILLSLWFILNIFTTFGQNKIIDRSLPKSSPSEIKVTPVLVYGHEFDILNAVFPNVHFIWEDKGPYATDYFGKGEIKAVINDTAISIDNLNIFLYKLKAITGKKRKYTNEQLAQAFIYFTYLKDEGYNVKHVLYIKKVTVFQADTAFPITPAQKYFKEDHSLVSENPKMNYKVEVEFITDPKDQSLFWKSDEWYFSITNHEIIFVSSQRVSITGKIRRNVTSYPIIESMPPGNYQNLMEEINKIKKH
jgi:hypothetical protein